MRAILLAAAVAGAALPLSAQSTPPKPAAHAGHGDPDVAASSTAGFPAGWSARFDRAAVKASDVTFVTMGDGVHFTTGPAATYYMSGAPLDGEYAVQATFTQTKAPAHPEAYGLVVFGRQMETPTQSYVYFMVRGDGKWMMKHRANDTDVHTIDDWTESPAIVKADAAGKATNTLRIAVGADSVRFLVNGQQLRAMSRTYLTDVSGVPGIRVNHNLDVHVSGWSAGKKE